MSAELGISPEDVKTGQSETTQGETDRECLTTLIDKYPEQMTQVSELKKVLTSPTVEEYGVAIRLRELSTPIKIPTDYELETQTRKIKLKFSHLFSTLSSELEERLSPRKPAKMIARYDKKLAFAEDHRYSDDTFLSLIRGVSFLDYDLVYFIATKMKDELLSEKVKEYAHDLRAYYSERVIMPTVYRDSTETALQIKVDREMEISTDKDKTSKLYSTIKKLLHLDVDIEEVRNMYVASM
jgi:hypothetical protein